MLSFRRLIDIPPKVLPLTTSWYLSDLAEAKGRQELYVHQTPQRLKTLREHAVIESAISSNRIEGVEVDKKRIGTVIFGKTHLHDRNEEEIRGYREALDWIHGKGASLPISETTLLRLHGLTRGDIWDAGQYKEKDGDIIERYPDGRSRIRFKTVSAAKTPQTVKSLLSAWAEGIAHPSVHPLIQLAVFNLDFLCIHPFRDGNGRVSRLLMLLQCYHLGFQVGRFISIERLIEQNKERYYETLEQSSLRWHAGKNDFIPYTNYLLYVLKSAYKEFEGRLRRLKLKRGEKTERILSAIQDARSPFRISEIMEKCPGSSIDLVRRTMKILSKQKAIRCLGRGPDARWEKLTAARSE